MKNNEITISTNNTIPKKPMYSFILYIFPFLFIVSMIRKIFAFLSMPNCRNVDFEPGFRFYYGDKIFAENVFLSDCFIMDYAPVYIGEGTAFGKNNRIITGTHGFYNRKVITAKPITIGKNVWITNSCIILQGVSIGDNSVIGAGSVVTKDIPANCFAAGNPCRVITKYKKGKFIQLQ